WNASVKALTAIELPCALAAIGQWADDGTAELDTTLEILISVALRRKSISPAHASALFNLFRDFDEKTFGRIVASAASGPAPNDSTLLEELAKDALLRTTQQERMEAGKAMLKQVKAEGGDRRTWIRRLKEMTAFCEDVQDAAQS